MGYSGVIFDFNGTLFWDTPLHNKAWEVFASKHGFELTEEDLFRKIHGKNNKDIFTGLLNRTLSNDELNKLISEKEGLYQQLCLKSKMELAPGAEDFFNYLKSKDIPFTIATASGIENVDFYFKNLPLSKWFDYEKVVYNDGTTKGKPNPDLYLKAMKIINKRPDETLVFEDAIMGIQAALNAKAGKIVIVNSNDDDYTEWENYQIIKNFDEVDRTLFN